MKIIKQQINMSITKNPKREVLLNPLFFILAILAICLIDQFVLEDSIFLTHEELYKKHYYKSFDNNFQYLNLFKDSEFFKNKVKTNYHGNSLFRDYVIEKARLDFAKDSQEFLALELERLNYNKELLFLYKEQKLKISKRIDDILDDTVIYPVFHAVIDYGLRLIPFPHYMSSFFSQLAVFLVYVPIVLCVPSNMVDIFVSVEIISVISERFPNLEVDIEIDKINKLIENIKTDSLKVE